MQAEINQDNGILYQFVEWVEIFLAHCPSVPKYVTRIEGYNIVLYWYLGVECLIGENIRISTDSKLREIQLDYKDTNYRMCKIGDEFRCSISYKQDRTNVSIMQFNSCIPNKIVRLIQYIMNCQSMRLFSGAKDNSKFIEGL